MDEQRVTARSVIIVSGNVALRQRLKKQLTDLRWRVDEAGGGAEAMACVETNRPEALVVDTWLPDLEVTEFVAQIGEMYPAMDLLRVDGLQVAVDGPMHTAKSPRRNELLHAIRVSQESGGQAERRITEDPSRHRLTVMARRAGESQLGTQAIQATAAEEQAETITATMLPGLKGALVLGGAEPAAGTRNVVLLPEMVGESKLMLELARLIRLVAPRSATVLIEGETGTGKEVVAKAIHRLSARAGRPFVVLNCAAIPESLLEAELFGHTRGAFTGAVQARTGRIAAADGGTLFLDEIGEMPLALQAKMLRFLECGELQRVGDNETNRVDVRVIAATHQPLEQRSAERTFRLDLYHRLAVFPLEVPALRDRLDDMHSLVSFFLEQMGKDNPIKTLSDAAFQRLINHPWPGNVRELMHVLERGAILAEDRAEIGLDEIRLRNPLANRSM